jgi:hypothetical protein
LIAGPSVSEITLMKATSVNIFRAAVVRAARGRADRGKWHTYFSPIRISKIVKELFGFFKPNFSYELYMKTE